MTFDLTSQALAVIVGTDISKPEQCYVVVDKHIYNIACPVKCIDLCFKTTFALHLKYSAESENVWLFLQKYIYGISTRFDKKTSAIIEVKTTLGL